MPPLDDSCAGFGPGFRPEVIVWLPGSECRKLLEQALQAEVLCPCNIDLRILPPRNFALPKDIMGTASQA